mgnify:CR=1 FL=1
MKERITLLGEIRKNDLLRNLMALHRHNTGFYIIGKIDGSVWASGMITTRGFLIKFLCEGEGAPESGVMQEVRDSFIKLAELKLKESREI